MPKMIARSFRVSRDTGRAFIRLTNDKGREYEFEISEQLMHAVKPIADQYALLRDRPDAYSDASRALLPCFKSYEVEGGSIGIWLARLWKREVCAALLLPGVETPLDTAPIIGISATTSIVRLRQDG